MTPDYRKSICWIIVFAIWILAMLLLSPGCTNGVKYQQEANNAISQNRDPPDPCLVAEFRNILEDLCEACKHAADANNYFRGYKEGIEYQKQKGCE